MPLNDQNGVVWRNLPGPKCCGVSVAERASSICVSSRASHWHRSPILASTRPRRHWPQNPATWQESQTSAQARTSIAGEARSGKLRRQQQPKARWRARVGYPEWKGFPWHLNLEYLESYWEVEHQSLLVPTGLTAYRMSCSIDWSSNVSLVLAIPKISPGCGTDSNILEGFHPEPPSEVIGIDDCIGGACDELAWLPEIIGNCSPAGESLFMSIGPAEIGGVIGCCPG